jgi:hypothetical protein
MMHRAFLLLAALLVSAFTISDADERLQRTDNKTLRRQRNEALQRLQQVEQKEFIHVRHTIADNTNVGHVRRAVTGHPAENRDLMQDTIYEVAPRIPLTVSNWKKQWGKKWGNKWDKGKKTNKKNKKSKTHKNKSNNYKKKNHKWKQNKNKKNHKKGKGKGKHCKDMKKNGGIQFWCK